MKVRDFSFRHGGCEQRDALNITSALSSVRKNQPRVKVRTGTDHDRDDELEPCLVKRLCPDHRATWMRDSDPSKEWNRALWKRPTHPDNYVPPEVFLASLQRNGARVRWQKHLILTDASAHFRPYAYWPLVFLTCTITQHIAVVFIFVAVFVQLNQHLLDPRTLVSICLVSFVLLYALWTLLSPATSKEKGAKDTRTSLRYLLHCLLTVP